MHKPRYKEVPCRTERLAAARGTPDIGCEEVPIGISTMYSLYSASSYSYGIPFSYIWYTMSLAIVVVAVDVVQS